MSAPVAEKPKATIESLKKSPPKRARELDSRDLQGKPEEKTIKIPGANEPLESMERGGVVAVDKELNDEDLKEEDFLNEPVTILINRSMEKNFAPKCTDLIAINGTWAEMLVDGRWVQYGYLPRGRAITVKRKYVEVLARARYDSFNTEVLQPVNEDPITNINSVANYTLPFQMIKDTNQPRGQEWLEKLLSQQV
jgi:hypothetical protein